MKKPLEITVIIWMSCCMGIMMSLELAPYSLPDGLYPSRKHVTVSGTDSGALFAQMMEFAYSKYIKGVAVYSSTFYSCGSGNGYSSDYYSQCSKKSELPDEQQYNVGQVVGDLQKYEAQKVIDALYNLRNSRLYVFCSLRNGLYTAVKQLEVVSLHEKYLASPYYIKTRVQDTDELLPVYHVTDEYSENSCPKASAVDGTLSRDCTNLSVPAEAIEHLLGHLYSYFINPFYPYRRKVDLEPLRSFNQTEFSLELDYTDLDEIGYYYIPRKCAQRQYGYGYHHGKPCLVHIYFHGCHQGRQFHGTSHVKYINYLEVAEANGIIMLFPQILASEKNPGGCWDYAGFSGSLYATKRGSQVEAVYRMLARLLYLPISIEKPSKSYSYSHGSSSKNDGGGYKYKGRQQKRAYSYPINPLYGNDMQLMAM